MLLSVTASLGRCAAGGFDIPPSLASFVERFASGKPQQLPLPIAL
jgi:hypothetical protein